MATLAEIKAQRAAKAASNNNAVTSNNAVNSDLLEGLEVLSTPSMKVVLHLDSMERIKAFRLKQQGLTLSIIKQGFVIEGLTEGVYIDTESINDFSITFKSEKELNEYLDTLTVITFNDYNKPTVNMWSNGKTFDIELTKPYKLV